MKSKHIEPDELFGTKEFFQYIKIKGKYYKMSETGKDGVETFIEVPAKDVNEQMKIAKKLANTLKDNLDANKVLMEIFMSRYNIKDLRKLHDMIFKSKKKYKPKTRDGHCVDMKIGNHIIPIVD